MKKLITTILVIILTSSGITQTHVYAPSSVRSQCEPYLAGSDNIEHSKMGKIPFKQSSSISITEEDIGNTRYDLQTQGSISSRIVAFADNTIGAVFNYGTDNPNFSDRGTGYNYFDGTGWGNWPDTTIESMRSGWPAYQAWGENGEIVAAHVAASGTEGLLISKRENKGMGAWEEIPFNTPPGADMIHYPLLATGGADNQVIHLLAQISSVSMPYQGVWNPPVYSRSTDGGLTWDPENEPLPELSSNYYYGFGVEQFNLVAKGDCVAILYGGLWTDLGLLKSSDGGDTWEKTIIWEHPYPFYNPSLPADSFYCPDGAHHLAFDSENRIHVVFAITRAYSDGASSYWFPAVDGIVYWNEDRPTFSNDLNALSPYGDPGSELIEDYSLIGWSPDINYNGTLDILDDWGEYYLGFSSMPQICFRDFNDLFVVWSSVTEDFDNGVQNYRHIWSRLSENGGGDWGPFTDLTGDISHILDECVFPSMAEGYDDAFHLVYQKDEEPGMAVRGDLDPYSDNTIVYLNIPLWVGTEENKGPAGFRVSQNMPNPFRGSTTFIVNLAQPGTVTIEMTDMIGAPVYRQNLGRLPAGTHKLKIDGAKLKNGVYTYVISSGNNRATGKMICR